MASIKVKFRPSAVAGRKGVIYYQIIHQRKPRQLPTGYRIYPTEWDESRSTVVADHGCERAALVHSVRQHIRSDVERIAKIIRRLDDRGLTYTADEVVEEFKRYAGDYSLSNFMERQIGRLRTNGRMRTSETYRAALNSFRKFLSDTNHPFQSSDLMLDCLSPETMESYEAWHKSKGNSPNTISFYMRILRVVYNRAVDDGIITDRTPFRHVYTGIGKTVKRALPLSVIRKIRSLDLTATPALDYARDMFMMSFYLRGMSFIDMAFLRKTDLKDNHISYRRRKTGRLLAIGWTPQMQALLDKYPPNPTVYLLPIIRKEGLNERCAYRNCGYNINRSLKKIAEMIGLSAPLTMYVARHSWASAAKAKGIPLGVISEGMGHDSETTTQIYLASLDTSAVDKANSLILSSL